MTLETLRLIVVAGLAVWGAQDLCRRLLRWSEAGDVEHIERHAERRRALSDVTRGPRPPRHAPQPKVERNPGQHSG